MKYRSQGLTSMPTATSSHDYPATSQYKGQWNTRRRHIFIFISKPLHPACVSEQCHHNQHTATIVAQFLWCMFSIDQLNKELIKKNVAISNKRELPQAQTSEFNEHQYDNQTIQNLEAFTSKGVRGHFPFILIAPGRIIRPGLVNFPLQPLSLAAFMASFSCSPPSNTQQEKATISCMQEKLVHNPPSSQDAHRKTFQIKQW